MIRVSIVGATGYTGVELVRLLATHPEVELAAVTSRGERGKPVADIFPSLRGVIDLDYSDPEDAALADSDVVFFATPNGTAMHQAPALLEAGAKVIDLSADYRLRDPAQWEHWYGQQHASPGYLDEAVYGLPEMNRKLIGQTRLVANPGCYPTVVQLGFMPLLENDLVATDSLIADVKSGVSGAGRKLTPATQFCAAAESFSAYAAAGHRHLPEIKHGLSAMTGDTVGLVFVPHLLPIIRGIHATLYARLKDPGTDLHELYARRYAREQFVDVLPQGAHPDTASVKGSNSCRIAVFQPQGGATAVVLAVEDNLVKGAAGQAIQNMNILFGLPEATGLTQIALWP
ncbi:MAG: N-acetyl-gamma-glutamyl-phosphate reductase [Gammaproteobacteria bacterium]|nr:N-acetyl-gamma-glutamyl-phosphate reductase [Gammaproteobacteria bacterium]MCY4283532.1 N-acetyl-gamma-glutamyl-phosphate reductase [Gammaproteobacteria bacterium]MCY4337546.1 N-acetyl-gamma-glutamyl-phosphate reductase [Gammaproteobacteria bacterium]